MNDVSDMDSTSHDPLCPNRPCSCEPDEYGHMPGCGIECLCEFAARVRRDERDRLERALWDNRAAFLENTDILLIGTHPNGGCEGQACTLHRRTDHHMRGFPQSWRWDRGIMERICPHGVGHPDPDDIALTGPYADTEAVHGCDGCCR